MRLKFFVLVLIVSSHITFGQPTEQKKSYPANVEKIENIKAIYAGCTIGPCYAWWSIVLKGDDELLMQSGAHHPAGSRTRHFPIGTWRISGDTLKLNITPKSFDAHFMRTEYRLITLYDCELLIPLDSSANWNGFLKELQLTFEQSEEYKNYEEIRDYENAEKVVSRLFSDFVRFDYSADKKLLVRWEIDGP